MAIYALDDGSFLDDDSSALFAGGGGFVKGVGSAGNLIAWIQVGDSVAATGVSTLTAVVTYTQGGNNVSSSQETGGAGLGGRLYALDDGFVLDDGDRSWAHGESFILRSSGIVAERQMVVAYTQDDNAYAFEGEVGAADAVSLTLVYTQAANTVSAVIGDTRQPGIEYTQDGDTVSAAGVVKRVLLTATGELDVGAVVAYTQAGDSFVIAGDTGANNILILQEGDTLVAEAFAQGNLAATVDYTQDGDTVDARGTSAAIWGATGAGSGTWTPTTPAGGTWTPT